MAIGWTQIMATHISARSTQYLANKEGYPRQCKHGKKQVGYKAKLDVKQSVGNKVNCFKVSGC